MASGIQQQALLSKKAERPPTVVDFGLGKIPHRRGHHVWLITLLLSIVLSVLYVVWLITDAKKAEEKSKQENQTCIVEPPVKASSLIYEEISLFFIAMVATIVTIYITRFIQFIVERVIYFKTRYDQSWKKLALSTLVIKNWGDLAGFVFLLISSIILVVFFTSDVDDDTKKTINVVLGAVGLTQFFTILMKLNDQTTAQLSDVLESEHFNIATGMAWNFFTGYIELCLTKSDDHSNLKKTLQKAGLENYMASTKLVLLVPIDCIVKGLLDDHNIKAVAKVRSRKCNRAGVKDRVYWQTIYQITSTEDGNNRYYYCCCEYVTPIDTFYQMKEKKIVNDDHFTDQIKLFVKVLSRVLDEHIKKNEDCVRLLTFDPLQLHSVSHMMVDALKKMEGDGLKSFDSEQDFPEPTDMIKEEYQLIP